MTFSIAAVDPATGEVGAAAATRFLAVGAGVLWAEVGVGAVATQAMTNIAYGPAALDLLRGGADPQAALDAVLAPDDERDHRQVGVLTARGEGATFTGTACFDWAGGRVLDDAVIQGNILVGPAVLDAMEATWTATGGLPLPDRLLAVLRAGDAPGGDRRGRQSAAVLVRAPGERDPVDLRVDDHAAPLDELGRLLSVFELIYGSTPRDEWILIAGPVATRVRTALAVPGDGWDDELRRALARWIFDENLDGRWDGGDHLDPVVLAHLTP